MGGGLRFQPLGDDGHRLDGEVDVLQAGGEGRFVDLDKGRAGAVELDGLQVDGAGHAEDGVAAVVVALHERPLDHGVGPGEHALHGLIGEALGEAPQLYGDGARPAYLFLNDRLVVVAVAVGAHEAADLHAFQALGEEGDHVAAGHLAVDQDVEADLLLEGDDLAGGLSLQLLQLLERELAGGVAVARLL